MALDHLRIDVPACQALVSYADPLHGHHGGVYQAASWLYVGRSINPLGYMTPDGQVYARRSFHDAQGAYRPTDMVKVQLPG